MGSATREALAATRAALSAAGGSADLGTGEELLATGRIIGGSAQLQSFLGDPSVDAAEKKAFVSRVFSSKIGAETLTVLDDVVSRRWSKHSDVLVALEELGLRTLARSAGGSVSIEAELHGFGEAVASNAELELALGSKLGDVEAKLTLVDALLAGKAAPQTVAIVRHLVAQPRGRRIGALLAEAARIVADEAGKSLAAVTSAGPIPAAQLERLQKGLSSLYGRPLSINLVVDPAVVGGLRIQVGDDVIDGSLSARINELRLQLAG
jgi:F-type H+-transporting ATPase subunit delta